MFFVYRIQYAYIRGSRFKVRGSGFKVQGSRFWVQGSGFWVQPSRWPNQRPVKSRKKLMNVEHRTLNIERPIMMALCFVVLIVQQNAEC
ncbi:hypothetical protein D1AOALGA4SA_9342 [Olavius algarvensis Delta 1 endosymbiont]|nr:hypothetical protein D1AOALGA4SA_9342 [Olavius algarvensis Delta 1 endosymbiont]